MRVFSVLYPSVAGFCIHVKPNPQRRTRMSGDEISRWPANVNRKIRSTESKRAAEHFSAVSAPPARPLCR
jgi:hypothetical protein